MIFKNIWRRVVGNVLINISPNLFPKFAFAWEISPEFIRLILAAVSINDHVKEIKQL